MSCTNIIIINRIININKGYITTEQISNIGIHRTYLKMMLDANQIKKILNGVYAKTDLEIDYYYALFLKYDQINYNLLSALYLHDLIEKPSEIYASVNQRYHNKFLEEKVVTTRENEKTINIGKILLKTKKNNIVSTYDLERIFCDLIINKKNLKNTEYYIDILFKKINLKKLHEYSKLLKIEEKIKKYYK